MKKLTLNKTEIKILSLSLQNDDRVQNFYSKEIFNCIFLSDYVSKLRTKLEAYFKEPNRKAIIETENQRVIKADGSIAPIGIYRISEKYKPIVKEMLNNKKA